MVSETSHCTSREDTCETNTETGHRGLRTPKSDKEAEAASSRFFFFFFSNFYPNVYKRASETTTKFKDSVTDYSERI